MTVVVDPLTEAVAAAVQEARRHRNLSVADLALRSGVSRTMVGKIERGAVQPTAALLSKIATAFGMTLSELIARAEGDQVRLVRRDEQPVWSDPDTGYLRRAVSPPASGGLELVEVQLPVGARVPYSAEAYRFIDQQILILKGCLEFREGPVVHRLNAGDCLQLGPPDDCVFANTSSATCRYLVVLNKREYRS